MATKNQEQTFEAALARLEEVVATLEEGALSLEESLAAFREGIALTAFCRKQLEVVEGQLKQLVKNSDGGVQLALPNE